MNDPNRQILLAEYQAAQSSAQHHDSLVWTVTSIMWGATVVLLGLVMSGTDPDESRFPALVLCALGIVLLAFVGSLQWRLRDVKRQKYNRCQEIEKELGMHQHSKLEYQSGSQTDAYAWVTGALILGCIVVAAFVWFQVNGVSG